MPVKRRPTVRRTIAIIGPVMKLDLSSRPWITLAIVFSIGFTKIGGSVKMTLLVVVVVVVFVVVLVVGLGVSATKKQNNFSLIKKLIGFNSKFQKIKKN